MPTYTTTETDLVAEIRHETAKKNLNNLTRTAAYLSFYQRHQEIDWALLAHLVSRNGGWNMTDLRGDWLPRLLSAEKIDAFFSFLERCNWLIFHDAFAQLLLYEQMKASGKDLTHLLSPLGVSRFMLPLWQQFLQTKNSARLTRGLIINEQQYIQQRVVHQPFYAEHVLNTFAFHAQSVLSLNQILFPHKHHPTDKRLHIAGITVHRFPSVEQRITIGKTLYELLFSDSDQLAKMKAWAYRIPHSGSRSDYWPHIFSAVKQARIEEPYQPRLQDSDLIPGHPKLYSPRLTDVWKNAVHAPADGVDWYRDEKWLNVLDEQERLPTINADDYLASLHLVETGLALFEKVT